MAITFVSKLPPVVQGVLDEVACKALITVAARLYVLELRHPRASAFVRELAGGLHGGYAWGSAIAGNPLDRFRRSVPRDPSWEAIVERTAVRAAQLTVVK